jgi:S1-C subfamily serine protease
MEEKINHSKKSKLVLFLLVNIILAAFIGGIFGLFSTEIRNKINSFWKKDIKKESSEIIKKRIIQEDSAVIDVVQQASPAVVSITIKKDVSNIQSNPFGSDFFEYFFGNRPRQNEKKGNQEKQIVGGGSGFLVTKNGMIVTNKHVVEDATAEYVVTTNDGQEHKARILAKDPFNDIALIKIEGNSFPTLKLGNSDQLKIGQTVIAIGNSLGEFTNTVSRGIVSGLKRNVTAGQNFGQTETLFNIIQTDAAINPGNSGGPLLDISGQVIGVNVAMAAGAENIGFAIPVSQIKKAVNQVKENGKISVPYIGIRYIPLNKTIQKENNLPYDYGVLIVRGEKRSDLAVIPGSPANKAGLVENDVILEINQQKIDVKHPLNSLINQYSAGEEVTLKIWHQGKEKEVKVILEERK